LENLALVKVDNNDDAGAVRIGDYLEVLLKKAEKDFFSG